MTDTDTNATSDPEFGPGDRPGAPGPIPNPDHHAGVPAAPATNPPEPPIVPSDEAIGAVWSLYGPTILLVGAGLLIVLVVLIGIGKS